MDLSFLREALAPLSDIGKDEFEFEVGGVHVTLRPLLPKEEVAVQKYSAAILDASQDEEGASPEDNMSRASALDYFDRFRIEVISHSLCSINGKNLRQVEFIPTGENLPNGTPVRVPRHVAMRDIITANWSRSMITICFARYGDLVTKLAADADKIAQTSVSDIEVEIERVETRLSSLKSERGRRTAGDPGIMRAQVEELVGAGARMQEDIDSAVAAARAVTTDIPIEKPSPSATPNPLDEVTPSAEEPPIQAAQKTESVEKERVVPEPQPRQSVIPSQSSPPVTPPAPEEVMSSFADPDEPGVLEGEMARIAGERSRILQAREQASAQAPPMEQDILRGAVPDGQVGGVDAYRLPSQTLSPRGQDTPEDGGRTATVNPTHKGELNPNFKKSQ